MVLLRFWAALSPGDVSFLLLAAASTAGMLAWQRARPATYQRWSAAPRALQRLLIAFPTAWKVTRQALASRLPYGHGAVADAAVFALVVFFASCGASGNGLVRRQWWFRLPSDQCLLVVHPAPIPTNLRSLVCRPWRAPCRCGCTRPRRQS